MTPSLGKTLFNDDRVKAGERTNRRHAGMLGKDLSKVFHVMGLTVLYCYTILFFTLT